ncbi:NUDIX hydrolase [Brevibacillus dissolubilis]|uniref:NUDIX hydrolase n=1 Tax=Brevibacillus dissolubilis TaxID=1844116 RepID=UPI001116F479|nr:NUDIX domain-containing protein [Brevibacillus dissolubilis]
METETLTIFDHQHQPIGVASRGEVHRVGHWHETFQCWLTGQENGVDMIYFQIRSAGKKDYPNLLDITAAGHLLSDETVQDGVREVQEELGIDVSFDELVSLGVIENCLRREGFIDNEFSHVFLYPSKNAFEDFSFKLQKEEVSGMVRVEFGSFYQFCFGEVDELVVDGFEIGEDGEKIAIHQTLGRERFVPHQRSYWERVATLIREQLEL